MTRLRPEPTPGPEPDQAAPGRAAAPDPDRPETDDGRGTGPDGDREPPSRPVLARALAVHAALTGTTRDNPHPLEDRGPADTERRPLPLPDPGALDTNLATALLRRRSRYHFADEPVQLRALSTLLGRAAGLSRIRTTPDGQRHMLSVAPAAGGLPVLRTYLIARRVDGLAPGVYRYDVPKHSLHLLSPGDPTAQLRGIYLQPQFAETAPVTLAVTADLGIAFSKYTLDHYRTVHVDAGILTQNLYLVITALDHAGCAVVGFDETTLARTLGCPRHEIPIVLFAVGERPGRGT